jgi:hypothetical protein
MHEGAYGGRRRHVLLAVLLAIAFVAVARSHAGRGDRDAPPATRQAADRTPRLVGDARPHRVAGRPPAILCKLPRRSPTLPIGVVRGLAHHLRQYPHVALARPQERRAARALLRRLQRVAARWRDARAAAADGFLTRTAPRLPGDRTAHYLHAEHRRFSHDGRLLDTARPESLIYANAPGRPLVLVGVMFSVPRGVQGPAPGGSLTRWHSHLVCARGDRRGLKPRADGNCPPGSTLRQGSEMLHVWFTGDLRSSYAIHAPQPELCGRGLMPVAACRASIRREM